jgi:hypothetical protein
MVGDRQVNGRHYLMVDIEEYSQVRSITSVRVKTEATCSGDEAMRLLLT